MAYAPAATASTTPTAHPARCAPVTRVYPPSATCAPRAIARWIQTAGRTPAPAPCRTVLPARLTAAEGSSVIFAIPRAMSASTIPIARAPPAPPVGGSRGVDSIRPWATSSAFFARARGEGLSPVASCGAGTVEAGRESDDPEGPEAVAQESGLVEVTRGDYGDPLKVAITPEGRTFLGSHGR
jgi:hypothetical protein